MIVLRSIVFNILWYANIMAQMVIFSPWYFTRETRREAWRVPTRWGQSSNWLQRHIVGTRFDVEGTENLPPPGTGYIVASKHQSIWEFYALLPWLDDPAIVVKKELTKIPLFGAYIRKIGTIPIERAKRGEALRKMLAEARRAVTEGRQLFIFPEGTRKAPGAPPDYRQGVTRMYEALGCPVVPVAHTSGLFWPRRRFRRYPGTLRLRFLPPIPPGLAPEAFARRLQETIEGEMLELYRATADDAVHPPIPPAVRAMIDSAEDPVRPGRSDANMVNEA